MVRRTARWLAAGVLLATSPSSAQEIGATHVRGTVWRIDGAIDNIVVSVGEDGVVMIDTGYPFAVEGVKSRLREIADRTEPDVLILTHQHHAFAAHAYAGPNTRIVAHERTAARMGRAALMAGVALDAFPSAALPDTTFSDSLVLRFNGEEISLFHLPAAHTGGDIVAWFRGSGVVAAGDAFVPHQPWISLDAGAHVHGLVDGLDRLLAELPGDVIVVPGHDETGTLADVRGLRDVVVSSVDSVSARIGRGMTLRQIVQAGLPSPLADWEGEAVSQEFFLESLYRSLVPVRTSPGAPTLEFVNGRWLDDGAFRDGAMYSVQGVLTRERPVRVDRTIDLRGGWAVPGFGEAHTHRFGDPATLEADHAAFLQAGVFYAMVQDAAEPVGALHRAAAAEDTTVDILYTHGVITPSWGVMPVFFGMMAESGRYGAEVEADELEGRLYFSVDDVAALERAWPRIRDLGHPFVKVIVAFSDDIARRRADPEAFPVSMPTGSARPGVTPDVLRRLVQLAHADGIAVSAHIETAADFRLAVQAGVDWIAHMPASWQIGPPTGIPGTEAWKLTLEGGFAARRARIPVVTTLSSPPDHPQADAFREVHAHNLEVLRDAGAPLAIGSDRFDGTSVDEALLLRGFDVLSDAQLLNLLATQTPRLLFPGRRIGHLREGYEASFTVLGSDPTRNLAAVTDIRIRVKNGWVLP